MPDLDYYDAGIVVQVIAEDLPEVLRAMLQQPAVDPTRIPYSVPGEDALTLSVDHNSPECAKVLLEDGRCNPAVNSSRLFKNVSEWSSRMTDVLLADERVEASRP